MMLMSSLLAFASSLPCHLECLQCFDAVSCFSKIQIGFTFLVPAHLGSPGMGVWVCVCVCHVIFIVWLLTCYQIL